MAVDGSIHINTKIDAKGINQGTKDVGKAVEKNVAKPTQSLTKSLGGILNVVKLIGKAFIAAFVGSTIINGIRNIVQEFDLLTGTSGDKFKALSGALETLKGAFVNLMVQAFVPMIPTIIEVVNWLTTLFQTVTQIVAALFGFESTVGNIMTKAASGAQKAAKSAKGALAAFDQINVLQKKEEPTAPEGPTATPAPIGVLDDILKKVSNLKKIWEEFLKNPIGVLVAFLTVAIGILQEKWRAFIEWVRNNLPFGDVLANILTIIGDTIKKLVINALETFLAIKERILQVFHGIRDFLTGVFTGDWALAWEGLKNIVGGVLGIIGELVAGSIRTFLILFGGLKDALLVVFQPVLDFLGAMFEKVKAKAGEVVQGIQTAWGVVAKWFLENVWNPLANGFGSMLTDVRQGFEKTFTGIKGFIKGVINNIIDFINGMIEGIVFGINTLIGGANAVGELVGIPEIGYIDAPKIPKLATGAVIPPNSEFLAVLGDQRGGRNIEAPESLIRQIVREETGKMQADISIRFEGSLASLVRELKPVIDRENIRVGNSLVKGAVRL
jgi:hypothetical protein